MAFGSPASLGSGPGYSTRVVSTPEQLQRYMVSLSACLPIYSVGSAVQPSCQESKLRSRTTNRPTVATVCMSWQLCILSCMRLSRNVVFGIGYQKPQFQSFLRLGFCSISVCSGPPSSIKSELFALTCVLQDSFEASTRGAPSPESGYGPYAGAPYGYGATVTDASPLGYGTAAASHPTPSGASVPIYRPSLQVTVCSAR